MNIGCTQLDRIHQQFVDETHNRGIRFCISLRNRFAARFILIEELDVFQILLIEHRKVTSASLATDFFYRFFKCCRVHQNRFDAKACLKLKGIEPCLFSRFADRHKDLGTAVENR